MMSVVKGSTGFGGKLNVRKVPAQQPPKVRSLRTPLGRFMFTRDKGSSTLLGEHHLMSNLRLIHKGPDGVIKDVLDTGSGLVTNVGVNLMSNDFSWANCTLKQANFHALGTGATAAASTDAWLQTIASNTNFAGVTNGYMTGTQSIIANSTSTPWSPIYQTQATFTCNGGAGIAVTEWIVAVGNWANINNLANSVTSTSLTDSTHTPFAAGTQVMGTVEGGFASAQAIPINTPATTPTLQVAAGNTTTVLTGIDNVWGSGTKGWLGLNNQIQTTPTNLNYIVFPTAFDHKVFGAVTLNNGDTLQVTYQLSINSGG